MVTLTVRFCPTQTDATSIADGLSMTGATRSIGVTVGSVVCAFDGTIVQPGVTSMRVIPVMASVVPLFEASNPMVVKVATFELIEVTVVVCVLPPSIVYLIV